MEGGFEKQNEISQLSLLIFRDFATFFVTAPTKKNDPELRAVLKNFQAHPIQEHRQIRLHTFFTINV